MRLFTIFYIHQQSMDFKRKTPSWQRRFRHPAFQSEMPLCHTINVRPEGIIPVSSGCHGLRERIRIDFRWLCQPG